MSKRRVEKFRLLVIVFFYRTKIIEDIPGVYSEVLDYKIYVPYFEGAVHVHSRLNYIQSKNSRGEILKRKLKEPFVIEWYGNAT